MAARFFVAGGVNNNYSTAGNWSLTSGGAGGAGVPTTADDVTLNASSPNCIVDVSSVCGTFTASAYTNTLTLNAQLKVGISSGAGGNTTFGAAMAFAGASQILIDRVTATLTTNGVTVGVLLNIDGATLTLADDLNISKTLTLAANFGIALNGAGRVINASGSVLGDNQSVGGSIAGLNLTGTGTLTRGVFSIPVTINTAGTITFSTLGVRFANLGTLTHIAGTVVATGSTLQFSNSGAYTITGAGATYANIIVDGGTLTLGSNINMAGTLTLASNFSTALNGNKLFVNGNLTFGAGGNCGGTTTFELTGTGTFSMVDSGNTALSNNVRINAPGQTVTVGRISYATGTITYIAGTLAGTLAVSVAAAATPSAYPFFGG